MSFAGKKGVEKAFAMLRTLPRVCLANIRRNPGTRIRVNNTKDYSVFWVLTNQCCIRTRKSEHLHRRGSQNLAYQLCVTSLKINSSRCMLLC